MGRMYGAVEANGGCRDGDIEREYIQNERSGKENPALCRKG